MQKFPLKREYHKGDLELTKIYIHRSKINTLYGLWSHKKRIYHWKVWNFSCFLSKFIKNIKFSIILWPNARYLKREYIVFCLLVWITHHIYSNFFVLKCVCRTVLPDLTWFMILKIILAFFECKIGKQKCFFD